MFNKKRKELKIVKALAREAIAPDPKFPYLIVLREVFKDCGFQDWPIVALDMSSAIKSFSETKGVIPKGVIVEAICRYFWGLDNNLFYLFQGLDTQMDSKNPGSHEYKTELVHLLANKMLGVK